MEVTKRRYPTKETAVIEVYGKPGEQMVAHLRNISESGAFLEWMQSQDQIRAGDLLRLTVLLSVIGKKRFVSASVVWANASGVGVQFVPKDRLLEFLSKRNTLQ